MLESFRNNMKGIAFGIVVLIAIVFAFSGVGPLSVTGSASETAVEVNGERISELAVLRAINTEKQRILGENEGLDPALLEDDLLRPQVVEQLVGRTVLSQEAAAGGMAVSSRTTGQILLENPSFQTDGKFDQDLYLYRVRNAGYTSGQYIESLENEILVNQYIRGFIASTFFTDSELALLSNIFLQERDYYYLTLPLEPVAKSIEVSDQQIADYYEANKLSYQEDEKVVVDYIELSPALFDSEGLVSEEQVKTRFDEQAASLESAESLQASHILLSDPSAELLAEIQAKLDAGEDFAALAKEYSEDVGSADLGGDLGFTSGDTFPEAFEAALASLEVGQVSAPVETDSGIHLIKLVDKQKTEIDFASERERIEQEMVAELRDQWLVEKLANLKELSYNAENLSEVAEELELTSMRSNAFSRQGGIGVTAYPAVIKAAFSSEVLNENYASEVIDLGDDRHVVIKLNKSIPARQKELAEVRPSIVSTITAELAKAQLAEQGALLIDRVKAGETVEAVAKSQDLEWQVVMDAQRSSRDVDAEVKRFVFDLPATADSAVVDSFYASTGDFVVVSLTDVTLGEAGNLSAEQKSSLLRAAAEGNSGRELQALQASLLADADIDRK